MQCIPCVGIDTFARHYAWPAKANQKHSTAVHCRGWVMIGVQQCFCSATQHAEIYLFVHTSNRQRCVHNTALRNYSSVYSDLNGGGSDGSVLRSNTQHTLWNAITKFKRIWHVFHTAWSHPLTCNSIIGQRTLIVFLHPIAHVQSMFLQVLFCSIYTIEMRTANEQKINENERRCTFANHKINLQQKINIRLRVRTEIW